MCGARDTRRPGGIARSSHWASIDIIEPPNSPGLGQTGKRAAGPREKSSIRAKSAQGPAGGLLSSLVQDHGVPKPGSNRSCIPCSLLRVSRGFVWRHFVTALFHLLVVSSTRVYRHTVHRLPGTVAAEDEAGARGGEGERVCEIAHLGLRKCAQQMGNQSRGVKLFKLPPSGSRSRYEPWWVLRDP